MAASTASSLLGGERSPRRNASTSEQASPNHGVERHRTRFAAVDARTWLGLEATHNPHRWVLPVTPAISTHGGFLFGGCGLGAAIEALEGTTERPVIWATAQYLSYANAPAILDIDVTVAVVRPPDHPGPGHRPRRRPRDLHGQRRPRQPRRTTHEGQWETMPDVAGPDDAPARMHPF